MPYRAECDLMWGGAFSSAQLALGTSLCSVVFTRPLWLSQLIPLEINGLLSDRSDVFPKSTLPNRFLTS